MVKRNRRTPFSAKSQAPQKYQELLSIPSSLEATVPSSEETKHPLGTSAPKEEEQVVSKPKFKKGRRTTDKSLVTDFIKNPLTWGVIIPLITAAIWANNTTRSIAGLETTFNKFESKFDQFVNSSSTKLEVIQQLLNRVFDVPKDAKSGTNHEFNLFNFSRNKPQ